jgi:hypothetical protein
MARAVFESGALLKMMPRRVETPRRALAFLRSSPRRERGRGAARSARAVGAARPRRRRPETSPRPWRPEPHIKGATRECGTQQQVWGVRSPLKRGFRSSRQFELLR